MKRLISSLLVLGFLGGCAGQAFEAGLYDCHLAASFADSEFSGFGVHICKAYMKDGTRINCLISSKGGISCQ